jgi:uncharacterized alkaline shock family protein YloU
MRSRPQEPAASMTKWTLAILNSRCIDSVQDSTTPEAANQTGKIEVSPLAVAAIAAEAVSECYGVVGMASRSLRESLLTALRCPPATKGIRVRLDDDVVVVDVHVIVEYGTRVSTVASNVIDAVRFRIERSLGAPSLHINVFVEDVRVDLRNA